MRVEARGIHRESLLQHLPSFVLVVLIERLSGDEHVGFDVGRIELEGLLRRCHRLRRVVVGERPRRTEEGRRPFRVALERSLEQFQRIGLLMCVQIQLAPGHVHGRVLGCLGCRIPEDAVGFVELSDRMQRTAGGDEIGGIGRNVSQQ